MSTRDRAVEWVGEWHPEAEGEAWEALVVATEEELRAIDAAADERDG